MPFAIKYYLAFARTDSPRKASTYGQVAQLVEQRTENPRAEGSSPPLTTINSRPRFGGVFCISGFSALAAIQTHSSRAKREGVKFSVGGLRYDSSTSPLLVTKIALRMAGCSRAKASPRTVPSASKVVDYPSASIDRSAMMVAPAASVCTGIPVSGERIWW